MFLLMLMKFGEKMLDYFFDNEKWLLISDILVHSSINHNDFGFFMGSLRLFFSPACFSLAQLWVIHAFLIVESQECFICLAIGELVQVDDWSAVFIRNALFSVIASSFWVECPGRFCHLNYFPVFVPLIEKRNEAVSLRLGFFLFEGLFEALRRFHGFVVLEDSDWDGSLEQVAFLREILLGFLLEKCGCTGFIEREENVLALSLKLRLVAFFFHPPSKESKRNLNLNLLQIYNRETANLNGTKR